MNCSLHIDFAAYHFPANTVVLDVVPHELVGIQLRRIGRQKEEPELTLGRFYELPDLFCPMGGMAIDDQENRRLGSNHQPPEKFDEYPGGDTSFRSHKS